MLCDVLRKQLHELESAADRLDALAAADASRRALPALLLCQAIADVADFADTLRDHERRLTEALVQKEVRT